MKKNWRLLACLIAMPALPLLAAETDNQEAALEVQETAAQFTNKKAPVGAQQKSSQNKDKAMMSEEESIQSMPVITPAVAPHVMDGTDTYVTLDFIWWKTVVGGMEYGFSGVVDNGSAVPVSGNTGKGHVQKPGFKFEPGFKAGIGVNMDHDGWDLYAEYTYLSSPSETNHVASSTGVGAKNLQTIYFYNPSLINPLVPLVNATCKWKQDFNVINFEMGRDYFISRYLTLRPFTGLKTAWIHEQARISMVPTTTAPSDGVGGRPTAIVLNYRQNMWGLGIRTGLNAGWHVTKNWSFYNDFGFTAMWADFHIHQKQNLTEAAIGGTHTNQWTNESLQTVIPVLEAGLGLSYITWWEQSRYRFEFRAGWEEQIWLDFNHFMTLGGTGNLSVQGLTVKGMLNF